MISVKKSIFRFCRKNSVLTDKLDFAVWAKTRFMVSAEKLDFTVLAGKLDFTIFAGKLDFAVLAKKLDFGFWREILILRF